MKQRILNLFIALDQLTYVVLTLGKGSPDETISAALWRMDLEHKLAGRLFRPMVDLLFRPLERDHCRRSFDAERDGRQLPAVYRRGSAA